MIAAGLLLPVCAAAVAGAVCLPSVVTAFWPRVFAFSGAGYAVLYAAIWIIGERRNLQEGGHRITRDALIVELGTRCAGVVALDSIAACSLIDASRDRIGAGDVWRVSPGEPANVRIALKGATQLEITAFGAPRQN